MHALFHVTEEKREPHPVYTLWERAKTTARDKNRLPLVTVQGPEWSGRLIVIHEADLSALAGLDLNALGN